MAQLVDGGSGGVRPTLGVQFVDDGAAIGDVFSIARSAGGSWAETWTAGATRTGAFTYAATGFATTSLANLTAAILADSAHYGAVQTPWLAQYFARPQERAMVLYANDATNAADDRVYGTFATQANVRIVSFSSTDYSTASATEATLPSSDPAARTFGFGVAHGSLASAETHQAVDSGNLYLWTGSAWALVFYGNPAPRVWVATPVLVGAIWYAAPFEIVTAAAGPGMVLQLPPISDLKGQISLVNQSGSNQVIATVAAGTSDQFSFGGPTGPLNPLTNWIFVPVIETGRWNFVNGS